MEFTSHPVKFWNIKYVYTNTHGRGPSRGRAVIKSDTKPAKGDFHYGPFGAAEITSSSKATPMPNYDHEMVRNVEFEP